jgi:hypothetical protein
MHLRHFFTVTLTASILVLAGCDDGTGGGNGGNGGSGGEAGASTGGGGAGGHSGGSGGHSGGSGGSGGAAGLTWYTTCGDPACGMASDDPALADCMAQMEGAACSTDGDACEIAGDNCNVNLVCASSDPKDQGCPISQAAAKYDIDYLSDRDRERIREEVVTMPLATWKYTSEGRGEKEHLGFIIDDQPPSSPAVRPSGERVDLYGYTSMAVAAIQAQQREIEALRREVQALRDSLPQKDTSATCSSPSQAGGR